MNWTEIILGLFTLLSTCGWFVAGRKYRQEVESLKADNRMKDMELGKAYVDELSELFLLRASAIPERAQMALGLASVPQQHRPAAAGGSEGLTSSSSFAPRQIERARLRSVWRRFAYGDSPAEECDTTPRRLPSQC